MIRKPPLTVFLSLVIFSFSPLAGSPPKPSDAELAAITARGVLLAGYDNAAWRATDAVQATKPKEGLVRRYIASKAERGWLVAFGRLNEAGDRFLVAFEAFEAGSPERFDVKAYDPPREDTGFNLAAARALDTALTDFRGENRPYNAAVLPADGGRLFAYVYPAQVKAGVYPIGGDVRYLMSPDGLSIVEKRQMHKTIIERNPADAPGQIAGGTHSHVLSDVPEDSDVFLVLTRKPRIPEYIGAGKHVYAVEVDGKIKIVK
jgi:hypothetical protein